MPATGGARLFLGVVGSRAAADQVRPGRGLRPASASPGRGRSSAAVERLRLLLNVKALIDPSVVPPPVAPAAPQRERRTS